MDSRKSADDVQLVAAIYDAVLDSSAWPNILDRVAARTGARCLNLMISDFRIAELQMMVANIVFDASVVEEYQREYAHIEMPVVLKMRTFAAQQFVTDEDLLRGICSYDEFPTLPWLESRAGLRRRTSVRLNDSSSWLDVLTFNFAKDRGQMTEAERTIAQVFLPHLAKAVELTRPFHLLRIRFQAVLSALDRLHIGVLIVRKDGAVLLHNREAERIATEGNGLRIDRAGYVRTAAASDQAKLGAAIAAAAATSAEEGTNAGASFSVRRPSHDDALLVEVAPVRDEEIKVGDLNGAVIFVIDPQNRMHVSTQGMQELFSLSDAESEVCRLLAEGLDTREIADHRNVGPATVRSQMKQLFQKTGVGRQVDLVRLALSINLPVDRPDAG